ADPPGHERGASTQRATVWSNRIRRVPVPFPPTDQTGRWRNTCGHGSDSHVIEQHVHSDRGARRVREGQGGSFGGSGKPERLRRTIARRSGSYGVERGKNLTAARGHCRMQAHRSNARPDSANVKSYCVGLADRCAKRLRNRTPGSGVGTVEADMLRTVHGTDAEGGTVCE